MLIFKNEIYILTFYQSSIVQSKLEFLSLKTTPRASRLTIKTYLALWVYFHANKQGWVFYSVEVLGFVLTLSVLCVCVYNMLSP